MFNKLKSALYTVVGGFDPTEAAAIGNYPSVSHEPSFESISNVARQNRLQAKEKTFKFPYSRPEFLQFSTEDEILVTADHGIRPIICPRDISKLSWNSGYAETINAGKSKRNEDQSAIYSGILTRCVTRTTYPVKSCESENNHLNGTNTIQNQPESQKYMVSLPYYYFGVFDGHAGWGAAVAAANQLHHIIHEKLCEVLDLILPDINSKDKLTDLKGPFWSMEKMVTPENAIIGALEQAFWIMDQQIAQDRLKHHLSGGCTACVAVFILGKVFVSNAGDSRATIAFNGVPVPMSFDFTPESETQRIRKLGARHPELLGKEFTHLEYLRRPLKQDLGKRAAYRDHYMKGWALKIITEDDLRYPLVCGEGKRSRVLATIGVTRGFGDHDLKAQFSGLLIKPFLSPEPQVKVFDLTDIVLSDRDVLILGTDGLWDITSNEKAVEVSCLSLSQFPLDNPHKYKYRYTSAAHDLVLNARGRLKEHSWRTSDDKHATIDDISVFVIPLNSYKVEYEEWQQEAKAASALVLEVAQSAIDVDMNHQDIEPMDIPYSDPLTTPLDDQLNNTPTTENKFPSLILREEPYNGEIHNDTNEDSSNLQVIADDDCSNSNITPIDDYFEDCDNKNCT